MGVEQYDFSGYATRNDLKCSDGRTIRANAFKHQDGMRIPLLYQHGHSDVGNVLGYAILENREDGVYAYGNFNDTQNGKDAKLLVLHGDITSLSIYANELVERAKNVIHGKIKELSLVIAGANPGAFIDNIVLQHGDSESVLPDEAIIYTGLEFTISDQLKEGENVSPIIHSEERTINDVLESMTEEQRNVTKFMLSEALSHSDLEEVDFSEDDSEETIEHADGEKTVKDVFDSMTEEQQNVVYFLIGEARSSDENTSDLKQSEELDYKKDLTNKEDLQHEQEGTTVHNIFENNGKTKDQIETTVLSHSDLETIFNDARSLGSVKKAVEGYALSHGIDNIDVLFPDARAVTSTPEFIKRRTEWVDAVMSGTNHTPFSRIKSVTADITLEAARAKGYIKGNLKKEEFFSVAKRATTPQTIYKKQKLDRDDILDITDFDVVAWLKGEMRLMLEEELARAILIGDGRSNADEDKISETNIRPIATDAELYQTTVYVNIDDASSSAEEIIDALTLNRRHYRGSGNPTFYTSETILAKMLMIKDTLGRRIYNSVSDLAVALRVRGIVAVEVMEDAGDLLGIMVNLQDYTIGADRGGDVTMFDDFDIDYNQQKYLIETRVSGALVKFKSAIIVRKVAAAAVLVVPEAPDFTDNDVTVATTTGVTYKNKATGTTLTTSEPVTVGAGETLTVIAVPASTSYFFASSSDDEWTFEYQD